MLGTNSSLKFHLVYIVYLVLSKSCDVKLVDEFSFSIAEFIAYR